MSKDHKFADGARFPESEDISIPLDASTKVADVKPDMRDAFESPDVLRHSRRMPDPTRFCECRSAVMAQARSLSRGDLSSSKTGELSNGELMNAAGQHRL